MPIDTIIPLTAIVAVFAFFAAVLVFGDATWSRGLNSSRQTDADRSRR